MNTRIKGIRPRPRVALLGSFEQETLTNLRALFPTTWLGDDASEIEAKVDPRELDLIVIGEALYRTISWIKQVGVICFSGNFLVPGPYGDTLQCRSTAPTEAYSLPELPLQYDRLREIDLSNTTTIKGWNLIDLLIRKDTTNQQDQDSARILKEGALLLDPISDKPLASIFFRTDQPLGVAFLPNPVFRIFPWVETICTEWAKSSPATFQGFGDWTHNPKWMSTDEETLFETLKQTYAEKTDIINALDSKIASLQQDIASASIQAQTGIRRLITSQDQELVDEVALVFEALGYRVTKMDETIPRGSPRLEDLRLEDPDLDSWQAIVEVRGYSKSGGKTDDLLRLARFANHYQAETGRMPDKRIYVVNGQTDLSPLLRQPPLNPAPEDVREFGEQDGVIIWSLDLFNVMKTLAAKNPADMRQSIRAAKGRWP